jgi:hypothetical protein
VTIDGALRELTHDDAHQFLQKAVIATAREAHSPAAGPERFSEFLLHEYDHLAASLLANEDSGERRAAFFLTLCAGAAALVGLAIKDKAYLQYPERVLMLSALGVLIILGYSTLLRLVTRNAVSDRYKNQLARLRRYFLSSSSDPNIAFLPFDPFRFRASRPRAIAGLNRGGWVDTMALIVTFLASAFVAVLAWTVMTVPGEPYTPSAVVVSLVAGLIAGATVRPLLSMRGNRVYDRELQEGRDGTVPMKARLKD